MTIHRGAVCGESRTHGSGLAVGGAIPSPTIRKRDYAMQVMLEYLEQLARNDK